MKSYLQKHNKIKYSDHWSTPDEIYNYYVIDKKYYDPCKLNDNSTDIKHDLINANLFINPPYSNLSDWIDFAIRHYKTNQYHIVLLIPARTDTKYFHKLLKCDCDIEFIKGRLKFGNSKNPAPFPSLLIHLKG